MKAITVVTPTSAIVHGIVETISRTTETPEMSTPNWPVAQFLR